MSTVIAAKGSAAVGYFRVSTMNQAGERHVCDWALTRVQAREAAPIHSRRQDVIDLGNAESP